MDKFIRIQSLDVNFCVACPGSKVAVIIVVTHESFRLNEDCVKMATLGQELGVDDEWHRSYNQSHNQQQDNDPLSFDTVSDTPILDETIAIVKDKVWSFRAALKGMAEALVNFGLSPTVVGYSTVPLGENDCLAERDEGEEALRQVIDEEILARSPFTGLSEDGVHQRRLNEESSLVHHDEDVDDSNHAFVEAGRKEAGETR
ncbi:hypothetical protein Mapa_001454 [Marchantia paleacea]|nr:hypothetical protein Mapa_001454 [Marchantia paleacea]